MADSEVRLVVVARVDGKRCSYKCAYLVHDVARWEFVCRAFHQLNLKTEDNLTGTARHVLRTEACLAAEAKET